MSIILKFFILTLKKFNFLSHCTKIWLAMWIIIVTTATMMIINDDLFIISCLFLEANYNVETNVCRSTKDLLKLPPTFAKGNNDISNKTSPCSKIISDVRIITYKLQSHNCLIKWKHRPLSTPVRCQDTSLSN
jgi:hypothetical protein